MRDGSPSIVRCNCPQLQEVRRLVMNCLPLKLQALFQVIVTARLFDFSRPHQRKTSPPEAFANEVTSATNSRLSSSVVPTGADLKSMYRLSLTPVLGQQLDVFKLQLCSCLGQHRAFSTFKPSLDSWDRGDDLNKCHHGENHGEPDHATRVGAAFLGGGFDRNPETAHCLDWSALALHAFLSDLGELVVRQFSPLVRHCSPPCPGYGFQAL